MRARHLISRTSRIPGTLLRIREHWLRVFRFETRRMHESQQDPPRTVGQTCQLVESGPAGLIGEAEAVAVCLQSPEPTATQAAKEKVVFCDGAATSVYQADRKNRAAALCACGNATCASAAMTASLTDAREVTQCVRLPDGEVDVRSSVHRLPVGTWRVEQSWDGIKFEVREARLAGRDLLLCTGTLNDYVIVQEPDRASFDRFALDDALSLWDEAKSFGFANPLQARLVALAPSDPCPAAKFFTCGRAHPGAPLTGLATLTLAAAHADWLATLLKTGEIEHARGRDLLPMSRDAAIEFAPIQVKLD